MHTCGKCGFCKPDDAFYRRSDGKLRAPCKACMRAYRPPHEAVTEKRCSVCGVIKGVEDFGPTRNTKSGRRSACRPCERNRRPKQIIPVEEKRCPTCQTVKPASDYYADARRPDGLCWLCRKCQNKRARPGQKRYQAANRERVREWNRRAVAKFLSAPGRLSEQIERLRAWNAANPDSKAVREQKRRARKAGTINDFTRTQWEALKVAYGYRCAYCGEQTKRLTMDHVVPLAKGGEHTARNIVPACKPCNLSKGTKPAPDHQIALPV